MPAASCRIMPARSIKRCETISASFGFSFKMGRKNRDNRMGSTQGISWERERGAVKPDRLRKHKGGYCEKAAKSARLRACYGSIDRMVGTRADPAGKPVSAPENRLPARFSENP